LNPSNLNVLTGETPNALISLDCQGCWSWSNVTTDGQSVSMSWRRAHCGTFDRILILYEFCRLVSVGRPLWREVGSVSCQPLSHVTCFMYIQYMQGLLETNEISHHTTRRWVLTASRHEHNSMAIIHCKKGAVFSVWSMPKHFEQLVEWELVSELKDCCNWVVSHCFEKPVAPEAGASSGTLRKGNSHHSKTLTEDCWRQQALFSVKSE
jgi:hypothetical protein